MWPKSVDIFQIFITNAAVFGVCLIWFNFTQKAYKNVRFLNYALFIDDADSELNNKKIIYKLCSIMADPNNNVTNYAKFIAVMPGSVALKQYLEAQKILPTS